jgi:hypothetical protein
MDEYDRLAAALRLCVRMGVDTQLDLCPVTAAGVALAADNALQQAQEAIANAHQTARHETAVRSVVESW